MRFGRFGLDRAVGRAAGIAEAGVAETAEHRSRTNQQIGADPIYIASLYENMLVARPK